MDYQYVEKYTAGDVISQVKKKSNYKTSETDVFIRTAGTIMHFVEIPYGIPYVICGNVLIFQGKEIFLKSYYRHIMITDDHVFVAYPECLEVLHHNGRLFKHFKGSFLYKNNLFLQQGNLPYVVDRNAHTVFVPQRAGLLDFTETGAVVYASEHKTRKDGSKVNFLVIETLKKKTLYNGLGNSLLKLDNITLYKGNISIEDPFYAVHFFIDGHKSLKPLLCHVALTASSIWVICESYVAKMDVPETMHRVVTRRLVAHNFLTECTFHDLICALASQISICLPNKSTAEDFLVKMLLARLPIDGFVSSLQLTETSRGISRFNASQILCRAYRRTDDPGRKAFGKYIDFPNLCADDMYCVIAFKPRYIGLFVKKCKKEERLFYIHDLIKFCQNIGREEELKRTLLENGLLFYEYPNAENFLELERQEAHAQLLRFKACRISENFHNDRLTDWEEYKDPRSVFLLN